MKEEDIKIVYKAIETFGDSFWTDFDQVEGLASNNYLFDDIVKYVNQLGYDLKLEKLEDSKTEEVSEREFEIVAETENEKLSPSWFEIVGERRLVSGTFVGFGMAEECIGLLEFVSEICSPTFEVGVGESLRPYIQLYLGDNGVIASKIFIEAVNKIKKI